MLFGTKKILSWMLTGPDSDPLRDGFQATSLDQDEVCLVSYCLSPVVLLLALVLCQALA